MRDTLETKLANGSDDVASKWFRPEQYDLADQTDRRILERKFYSNQVVSVHDSVENVAVDLCKVRHPDQNDIDPKATEYYKEIVGQGSRYGLWFYFPWSRQLVHFPPVEDHRRLRTARNQNLITDGEQRVLYASSLAIFGMSVGSNVVDQLLASGIGGKLILADPDSIEPTNLNRISGTFFDVGSLKVDRVARKVSETDPYIEQVHIKERVDADSLSGIIEEHHPDILIDEVDDLSAKAAIRLEGSRSRTAVIMATDLGDKSIVDVERHDLFQTKSFNGRLKPKEVSDIVLNGSDPKVAKRALSRLIGIRNVTPRLLDSFMEQGKTLAGIPQLGTTAAVGGALVALSAREILLGRKLDSGRYIFSPKDTLELSSPTSIPVGIRTLIKFAKNTKG